MGVADLYQFEWGW